ncbi:MAG: hypothetical protein ACOCVF_01225 [bacterium]
MTNKTISISNELLVLKLDEMVSDLKHHINANQQNSNLPEALTDNEIEMLLKLRNEIKKNSNKIKKFKSTVNSTKQMTYDELIASGVEPREAKLKTTVFFIEANSFETMCLWEKYKDETNWEEDSMGVLVQVGEIDGLKPVYVSFSFAKIFGKRICFFDVTSRYADYAMIQDYIKDNFPVKWDNGSRDAITDAMNFHHVIDTCKNN